MFTHTLVKNDLYFILTDATVKLSLWCLVAIKEPLWLRLDYMRKLIQFS